jgi:hypothetical protein
MIHSKLTLLYFQHPRGNFATNFLKKFDGAKLPTSVLLKKDIASRVL